MPSLTYFTTDQRTYKLKVLLSTVQLTKTDVKLNCAYETIFHV